MNGGGRIGASNAKCIIYVVAQCYTSGVAYPRTLIMAAAVIDGVKSVPLFSRAVQFATEIRSIETRQSNPEMLMKAETAIKQCGKLRALK